MSFKDRKRDDRGHVIGNDEVDGQECKHVSGQADKVEDQKYNKEMQAAQNQNADMREAFDDDYEEEFASFPDDDLEEDYRDSYERNAKVEGGTTFEGEFDFGDKEQTKNIYEKSKNKVFKNEYISDDPIFKVVGITDDGYGIVLKNSKGESWDVPAQLAETGGVGFEEVKDTSERKLVGAMKTQAAKETWPPQDLKQYVKKIDNGYAFDMNMFKDKSLDEVMMLANHPDFKENTVVHNAVMKAIYQKLKEQPNIIQEGSPRDEFNKSQAMKKQKYKEINGMIYPVDADGKIDKNNKFPNLKAFKDVYGENVEEDK